MLAKQLMKNILAKFFEVIRNATHIIIFLILFIYFKEREKRME